MKRSNILAILLIGVVNAIKVGSIIALYTTHMHHAQDECHTQSIKESHQIYAHIHAIPTAS